MTIDTIFTDETFSGDSSFTKVVIPYLLFDLTVNHIGVDIDTG